MFSKNIVKTVVLVSVSLFATAQAKPQPSPLVKNPPIAMEAFAGHRAFSYQMIVNKKLQSVPGLGFFGVTNFQAEWGTPQINDYMLQGNLTYSFIKGFDVTGGFIWNPVDGIRPSAGIMYTYGSPDLLIVANPRIDLSENANTDLLALIEYKPALSEKLRLYSRAQGLYTYNLGHEFHARSYAMFRAGITVRDVSFGFAANFDFYGPTKHHEYNMGGFVLVNLF